MKRQKKPLEPVELDEERYQQYLYLALERHRIYLKREAGEPPPWTDDPILQQYHFCNVYRRLDRTSQWVHWRCRRQQGDPGLHYVEAVLGRHTNRQEILQDLPKRWYKLWDRKEFEAWLMDYKLGSSAYKIHNPRIYDIPNSINRRDGIAALVYYELGQRDHIAGILRCAKDMHEAHSVIEECTTSTGFTAYQVLMDLMETDFWKGRKFDTQWAHVGYGATLGARYLAGGGIEDTAYNRGNVPTVEWASLVMEAVRDRIQEDWPKDWPTFDIHVAETMLCEYYKYCRKSGGHKTGRRYPGGP